MLHAKVTLLEDDGSELPGYLIGDIFILEVCDFILGGRNDST